ncbi:hypothetical protein BDR07DRAFT_1487267 [Suillus spraguei]|nr:hypothetical protein BDR07DRAFT_1487267 [Suillus spraguei]
MPPACCQHARRSACLKVNTPLHLGAMDEESNNQSNPPLEQSGPRLTIQWHNDRALTDTLVNYLTTHPADCKILFYSDGKKAMAAADDGPSGSDKGQIYGVLAKLICLGLQPLLSFLGLQPLLSSLSRVTVDCALLKDLC